MRNKEEEKLLNEIHEMKMLMEYMDENTASTSAIKQTARTQAKNTDFSGIENVREKEVIVALQQLIDKFKGEGNQYSQKVKMLIEKLWAAVNTEGAVNEEVIEEDLKRVVDELNFEEMMVQMAKKLNIDLSLVPELLQQLGNKYQGNMDVIKAKTKEKQNDQGF
jgi:hypothetical protein